MREERFQYLPFEIVDRKSWGAQNPVEDDIELVTPVPFVIHTYTDTEPCFERGQCMKRVRDIQARDLSLGLSDIRYNFVIGGDSTVYVGRGWGNLPDQHDDYPQLYERSIEIAHIGFQGEPKDDIKHVVQLFLRFGVATNHLRSNFKCVKHFKESIKDEEHYALGESGDLELKCYKKLGVETEREEEDEYKVLSDLSPRQHDYVLEKDNDDDDVLAGLDKTEYVDVIDGVRVDSSLLDPKDKVPIDGGKPDPSFLDTKNKTYLY